MPLQPECSVCKTQQGLSRCQGCQVAFYCGRDHQAGDWQQHKATCTPTKKTRNKLTSEIEILNTTPSSFMFTERPFENSVGQFWGILDTRDYMRARYAHVEALLKAKNRTAVQTALDHLLDMLRLNRSDNMGVRDIIPTLYLRLGRDQECYDFLKWWYTCDPDGTYDWGNTDLAYLNIKNANAFEPFANFNMGCSDLSRCAMLCLLKWRLFTDLKALDNASVATSHKLPAELVNQIRSHMVSDATEKNAALMRDVANGRDISGHVSQLERQVGTLWAKVDDMNEHYWEAVIEPGSHLTARPAYTSAGELSEMQLSLAQTYDTWVETPGAIEWLHSQFH